ncbi:hypothetical protein STEG23_012873 [Scotinomys teguina]
MIACLSELECALALRGCYLESSGPVPEALEELDEENPREKQKMSEFRDTGKPRQPPTPCTAYIVGWGQWQRERLLSIWFDVISDGIGSSDPPPQAAQLE